MTEYERGYERGRKNADLPYFLPFGHTVEWVSGYKDGYYGTPPKQGGEGR